MYIFYPKNQIFHKVRFEDIRKAHFKILLVSQRESRKEKSKDLRTCLLIFESFPKKIT
jgi:hypothetical protein